MVAAHSSGFLFAFCVLLFRHAQPLYGVERVDNHDNGKFEGSEDSDSLSDTVGKVIKIGVAAYLSQYINSVTVTITKGPADTDTTFTFANQGTWTDTLWLSIIAHSAGTRTVSASAVVQGEPNYSLTAKLVIYAKASTISYDGNGSTGGKVPVDSNFYPQGISVTVRANVGALVRTGYAFAGWNTSADGKGTTYEGGETFKIAAANDTLFAVWTQNPTYSVIYNGNSNTGGIAPTDANAYQQGSTVTVKSNTGNLSKTGYTFAGWNTAADGTGTTYAAGASITMPGANITLYAVWTKNPAYTVDYNANGGDATQVPVDDNAYQQGATVTVMAAGPLTRMGYNFAGWNTAADGFGISYATAATFAMGNSNVVLFAKWTTKQDTVTFNSNGGSAVASQIIAYGGVANAPTAPTQAGFIFAGWYADQALTSMFPFTTPITASGTLYAKWTVVYTVTYYGNNSTGGLPPVDSKLYTSGETVTVLDNTGGNSLTRTGWTFATKWNTNAAGTGIDYIPGTQFNITANVNMYAKWTATVAFDGQGATVAPSPATKSITTPTTTLGSLPNPPTKTSYVFDGWYSGTNGSGAVFDGNTAITQSITVYAKWTIKDADGNVYTEVKIGNQVWMVQNLKTTKYNDGAAIPMITVDSLWQGGAAFCWMFNDDLKKDPYGALYSWDAANTGKLAPSGWRVPNDTDWNTLSTYLGDSAGGKMKTTGTTYWASPNTGATNSSGFSAVGGGDRDGMSTGSFENFTALGTWWSTSWLGYSPYASCVVLTSDAASFSLGAAYIAYGKSVRCIRTW